MEQGFAATRTRMQTPMSGTFITKSPRGTQSLGRKFARCLKKGDCVALTGTLGAGKTALVRGIAEGLGLNEAKMVSSPTFVLVQEYPSCPPAYHIDLYRLADPEGEIEGLGIREMLQQGVVLVEWAERAGAILPHKRWEIHIEITGPKERKFEVRMVQ